MPPFAIAIIAVPALAIVVLLAWFFMSGGEKQPQGEVKDDNKDWTALTSRASRLKSEYQKIGGIARTDSSRQRRLKSLQTKLQRWLDDYTAFESPFLDSEGYLRSEYEGTFNKVKREINTLRVDVS